VTHQISAVREAPGYVDKRRGYLTDLETRVVSGPIAFTANAGGTTTTIVGANADPSTGVIGTNVMRPGDEFKLFTVAGVLKEETVFRVTAVAVAGSTTVTFTPAAAVATASTNTARLVGTGNQYSNGEVDRRLIQLGFTAARVATMTENDKDYQIRISDDPGSL
jgi:hypothetical protein